MAFPADVKLVRVTCGTGYDFSGEPISITLEVTPVLGGSLKRLIHAATGTFMTRDALTFKSDPGSPATFTVPSPAQAETWKDGSGEFFTNWSYSVTVTTRTASGKIQSWIQSFQPVDGQETVDLDLVPDGQIGSPTSAPAPAVTSVNGQSGAVVIDVGEAVTPESVAANLTVDAVDAKLPERLTESALTAAIDGALAGVVPTVEPAGVGEVHKGNLYVTNTATGNRVQVTTGQAVTDVSGLGTGVLATVSGVPSWVSPSGYLRPAATDFAKASLWGSSSAANLGPELTAEMSGMGVTTHYTTGAVGSFQITHIAAAVGVRPLEASAFTIPTSGGVAITPTNMPEANNTAIPVNWPGSFAGIPGTLTSASGSSVWTFTRTAAGTATAVAAGTPFIPTRAKEYQTGITFLNVAKNTLTNTSAISYEETVRLSDLIGEFFGGAGRHVLCLGHYQTLAHQQGSEGYANIEAFNTYMAKRYGARFVDIQAYLNSPDIWTDTGITPTQADLDAQVAYTIPPSLQTDFLHLNSVADTAIAKLIRERVEVLGWTVDNSYAFTGAPAPLVAWSGGAIAAAEGSDLTSLGAVNGAGTLTAVNAAEAPSVHTSGTNRFLRFLATDKAFRWINWSSFGSVVMIVKVSDFTAGTVLLNLGSVTLQRSGSGNLAAFGGSFLTTPMPENTWGVAGFTVNEATSIVSWNQTVATGTIGEGAITAFDVAGAGGGTVEIAAILAWNENLTAAQLQAVATELAGYHADLL